MKLFSRGYWAEDLGEEVVVGTIASPADVILRMKGAAAKRAYELMRRVAAQELYWDEFNCHAAAEFVMHGREIDGCGWREGDMGVGAVQMDVRRAVETLEMPCGLQVHHPCLKDGEEGQFAIHSSVLLGITSGGEALTLDKDGPSPLRLTPLPAVMAAYCRSEQDTLHFYGTAKTPAEPRVS